ncbi:hypothetical protein ARTHRO9V_150211 [Arthrobacter sp. 9V]|nr:hypothetical protein ARTHRO9V_150211 [Arthrobacter sp. 9V]
MGHLTRPSPSAAEHTGYSHNNTLEKLEGKRDEAQNSKSRHLPEGHECILSRHCETRCIFHFLYRPKHYERCWQRRFS